MSLSWGGVMFSGLCRHHHLFEGPFAGLRRFTEVNVLLLPGEEIRLHHVNKVFGCSVSVAGHVNDGERFAHSEEVHLLCVTLRTKGQRR